MIPKKILFLIFCISFFLCNFLFSDQCIHFEDTTHDFGEIKEEDGAVECDFIFYNSGDEPLKLKNVKAG